MSEQFVSSREATLLLGVKRETLYAYVSRSLVRTVTDPRSKRRRRYHLDDLLRLKTKSDARSGHGPVAGAALTWGEPVLETSLTRIDSSLGPFYAEVCAVDLARAGVPLERVADLLWPLRAGLGRPIVADRTAEGDLTGGLPVGRIVAALADDAAIFPGTSPDQDVLSRAFRLVLGAITRGRASEAGEAQSVAQTLGQALGLKRSEDRIRAIDQALVLCADHGLTASTFAGRIAASTGADPRVALAAAWCAFSGPKHGTASLQVEQTLQTLAGAGDLDSSLRERVLRGPVPGCGHPLYPTGDPRGALLIEIALDLAPARDPWFHAASGLLRTIEEEGYPGPNLDFGLALVCRAARLPPGSGALIFGLGRTVGWLAHIAEQAERRELIRPRARYVVPGEEPR